MPQQQKPTAWLWQMGAQSNYEGFEVDEQAIWPGSFVKPFRLPSRGFFKVVPSIPVSRARTGMLAEGKCKRGLCRSDEIRRWPVASS